MKRCHICKERLSHEDERYGYLVALRNGLYFPACFDHWFMWPDDHKTWPDEGYGRSQARVDELVAVLRETAA